MKLFSSNDRALTHKKLEEVHAEGTFPEAFCQEDYNAAEVYEVHHGLAELTAYQQNKVTELIATLTS